jgi:O-antigen chain-terminating methyltransferase
MNSNPLNEEYYLKFENAFRGSREEIVERLKIYLPLLNAARQASKAQLYGVDIGCGRGEWLELCNQNNIKMIGVDLNASMVQFCQMQGWPAIQEDAKSYLERQPDMSYSIISLFHVIEHLDRDYLLELIAHVLRVLAPSGILLMETPSSDNLLVASKGFYADPTHLRPIHPDTTCFELMHFGYSWARAYYINGQNSYRESDPIGLTSMLAGTAHDVVIIAQKPGLDGQLQPEGTWSNELRETETTLQAAIRIDSEQQHNFLQLIARNNQIETLAQTAINSAELAHRNIVLSQQSIELAHRNIVLSQQSIELANMNIELAHQRITALYNSRIWKATDPLRRLITAIRKKKTALLNYIYRNNKHHQP